MNKPLSEQRCVPCEGGIAALTEAEAKTLLEQTPQWQLSDNHDAIHRVFDFKGFYATMSFINMVAWIAQQQGHHPDVQFGITNAPSLLLHTPSMGSAIMILSAQA